MTKVGEVSREKVDWFLLSDGRLVSVHVAFQDKERTQRVTFYSDNNTFPGVTAQRLGISYSFMRNATSPEAEAFWRNCEETVKEIISV